MGVYVQYALCSYKYNKFDTSMGVPIYGNPSPSPAALSLRFSVGYYFIYARFKPFMAFVGPYALPGLVSMPTREVSS